VRTISRRRFLGNSGGVGLQCESCHYNFTELKQHMDDRLGYAKELGLTQMIISTFALPKDAKIADWMRAADDANKLGEQTRWRSSEAFIPSSGPNPTSL
jgi:hypothetical protein